MNLQLFAYDMIIHLGNTEEQKSRNKHSWNGQLQTHKNQYYSYNLQIIEGKNSIHTSKKQLRLKL